MSSELLFILFYFTWILPYLPKNVCVYHFINFKVDNALCALLLCSTTGLRLNLHIVEAEFHFRNFNSQANQPGPGTGNYIKRSTLNLSRMPVWINASLWWCLSESFEMPPVWTYRRGNTRLPLFLVSSEATRTVDIVASPGPILSLSSRIALSWAAWASSERSHHNDKVQI